MSDKSKLRGAVPVAEYGVRVRAGESRHARPSWLQARAPGLAARQRPWGERLWACLSVLMLVAGWDICSRLDERAVAGVLETRSPAA